MKESAKPEVIFDYSISHYGERISFLSHGLPEMCGITGDTTECRRQCGAHEHVIYPQYLSKNK